MPYTKVNFVDGVTALNAANLGKIDDAISLLDADVPNVVNGQWLKGVGGAAVWSPITPADIAGYPADGTKVLHGDGSWAKSGLIYDSVDAGLALPAATTGAIAIPAGFKHLRFELFVRSDNDALQNTYFRCNSDAGANYSVEYLQAAVATAPGSAFAVAQAQGYLGPILPAGADAGSFNGITGEILNYGSANQKVFHARNFQQASVTDLVLFIIAGGYKGAAVNTITFYPAAGNFVAGSRITVYGDR
jgi:hypothetical protein